jgi:hypothetical protein
MGYIPDLQKGCLGLRFHGSFPYSENISRIPPNPFLPKEARGILTRYGAALSEKLPEINMPILSKVFFMLHSVRKVVWVRLILVFRNTQNKRYFLLGWLIFCTIQSEQETERQHNISSSGLQQKGEASWR